MFPPESQLTFGDQALRLHALLSLNIKIHYQTDRYFFIYKF